LVIPFLDKPNMLNCHWKLEDWTCPTTFTVKARWRWGVWSWREKHPVRSANATKNCIDLNRQIDIT
jgi:hypothetical protein